MRIMIYWLSWLRLQYPRRSSSACPLSRRLGVSKRTVWLTDDDVADARGRDEALALGMAQSSTGAAGSALTRDGSVI